MLPQCASIKPKIHAPVRAAMQVGPARLLSLSGGGLGRSSSYAVFIENSKYGIFKQQRKMITRVRTVSVQNENFLEIQESTL